MNLPPPGNYRLICIGRGDAWQVEMRAGSNWSVGNLSVDLAEAIHSAQENYASEHPVASMNVALKPSSTDLSDLFI